MNRKQIKRKLGRVTKKPVGDLGIMERNTPVGFNRISVYADTETGYQTYNLKPWEYIGKPNVSNVLAEMTVFPGILCGQYRRRIHKMDRSETYEAGGYIKKIITIQYLDDFETFLIDMAYIYNEGRLTPTVFFHNSSYDIPIIEPLLKALDPDIILYYYVKPTDKGFIRGAFESPKYNVFGEFGDTLAYDRTISIDKAGEIIGKPKIKGIPYGLCDLGANDGVMEYTDLYTGEEKTYPLDKYLEYTERDVTIMREFNERRRINTFNLNEIMVEDWDKKDHDLFNRYCLTISGHSKKIANVFLKHNGGPEIDITFRFNLKDLFPDNYRDLYKQIIQSNNGGFTNFNKRFAVYDCPETHHIKYFDQNSMYPTIMTNEIPYGDILDNPPEDPYVTWYSVRVDHLSGHEGLDCMKYQAFSDSKCNGKPFFILKEYLDFVRENADIDCEIIATYYQRKTKVLAPLIEKYYKHRKEINKVLETMENNGDKGTPKYEDLHDRQKGLKLLMNALYGKLCERGHLLGCVFNNGEYHQYESKKEYYPCILTGSYITYMGRLCLLNKIKSVIKAGYDFLYADTDSVIFGCPKSADLTKIFGENRGNLGEGKDEGTFDLFLNSGLKKKYALFNRRNNKLPVKKRFKLALSGIPRRVPELIGDVIERDFTRGVRDMRILFNTKNNVVIKNCKTEHLLSNNGAQQIIYDTDFQMNNKLKKITHKMTLQLDDYTLEPCETK